MQELEVIAEQLLQSGDALREARAEAMSAAGDALLTSVRGRIGGSGKVQSWQQKHMGSHGGYTAVRARAKAEHRGYALGYITNAIESGHKTRTGGKRRRGRPARDRVAGKHMYRDTKGDAERIARSAAREIEAAVERSLK